MIAALIAAALAVIQPHKPTIPAAEWKMIRQVAVNYELSEEQTWLLAAIRRHENGRPGLEFGIGGRMDNGHPSHSYRDGTYSFYLQGEYAAGTIKRRYGISLEEFGKRYCPKSPLKWADRVSSLINRLKFENKGKLPGTAPAKRKITYP